MSGPRGARRSSGGVLPSSVELEEVNSQRISIPVVRAHAPDEAGEDDAAGGSGQVLVKFDRESSVFMTRLSLGPRGRCMLNTSATAVPVVRGPIACHLKIRTVWD